MSSRLWYMNADFETELAQAAGAYRRLPFFETLNRRLAPYLLWLAKAGDALLLSEPWPLSLLDEAERLGVRLISTASRTPQPSLLFTPWGWTPSAVMIGQRAGAIVRPVPLATVVHVNSKLWSHQLEVELGLALDGAATASTLEELRAAVASACPRANDKWVVKSPFGFAARDRVLGRGPDLQEPQAKWARRRFALGETLIFQPWLEVFREYGVVMEINADGSVEMQGISDLQTNGAGTGTGYILGRPPAAHHAYELESIARVVCERLFGEGYYGPVGMDALAHKNGLHPLLEINARYTMGFIAVAVERAL
ncbi:MAG TPA: hypothetical protein VGC64_11455, partial [Pyrinomonadaceae bacterium]